MYLTALEEQLNTYLAIDLFEDYGPNGLQVEGKREIKRAATAVSASLETIEAAVELGVDALVVHHGLFWKRDPYPVVGAKRRKLQALLKAEISLLAYHLPLDAHEEVGNNWTAARDLGWEHLEPFQIGVKGTFQPVPVEIFIEKVEAYYGHKAFCARGGKERVSSAALISGGAYRELSAAAKLGVDCFITGNFDEPAWGMAHEEGMHFLALGHTATERIGPKALGNYIQESFGLPCTFIDTDNPF